jgi:hypothetical protein
MTWDPQQPPQPEPYPLQPPPLRPQGGYTPPQQVPAHDYYGGTPYGQQPYVGYGAPPAGRPTSATVLAIIGIVFASIGLLNHGAGLLLRMANSPLMGRVTGGEGAWLIVDSLVSGSIWACALIGCIGLLKNLGVARKAMLAWACVYLGWLAVCAVMAFVVVVPATLRNAQSKPPGFEQGAYLGAMCFLILLGVYPILILSMLSRANVVATYDGQT